MEPSERVCRAGHRGQYRLYGSVWRCRECRNEQATQRRDGQAERERHAAYYEANRDVRRASARGYQARQRAQGKRKAFGEQAVADANKRAKWAGCSHRLTHAEWFAVIADYRLCPGCGADAQPTIDHVVALSQGGHNVIGNVQPLCLSCNSKKQTMTIDYRAFAHQEGE